MKNLAIQDELVDVIFYYEEEYQSVLAYFPAMMHSGKMNSCYARNEGHGDCSSVYVANLRKATPAEYRDTMNDLMHIYGYNLRIIE